MSFKKWSSAETAQRKVSPNEKPKDAPADDLQGPQPEKAHVKGAQVNDA